METTTSPSGWVEPNLKLVASRVPAPTVISSGLSGPEMRILVWSRESM